MWSATQNVEHYTEIEKENTCRKRQEKEREENLKLRLKGKEEVA
jgi:hypothetical protein